MKVQKRHEEILKILSEVPISTIQNLANELAVSAETIRKDLKQLADEDKIIQTHGGVVLKGKKTSYFPFDYRVKISTSKKIKIGKEASKLIEFGDTIFLESSTTCLALVQELCQKKEILNSLTIVTNSLSIVVLLEKEEVSSKVLFVGGWIDFSQHSTNGFMAMDFLEKVYVNKTFISGAALSRDLIVTGYYEQDILLQRKMMEHAEQNILMVDEKKYPKQGFLQLAQMSEFDYVVSDIDFGKEVNERIQHNNEKLRKSCHIITAN